MLSVELQGCFFLTGFVFSWTRVGCYDSLRCIMRVTLSICYRPPPNLLRQETEGTQIYLAVLNKTASEIGEETRATEVVEQSKGGDQKLREEAERQLVSFCGHILKEVASLQPAPSEAVQADFHRALALRSPVTVQVVRYINIHSTCYSYSAFSMLLDARLSHFSSRMPEVVLISSAIVTTLPLLNGRL